MLTPIAYEDASWISGLAEWRMETVTDMEWANNGLVLAVSDLDSIVFYDVYSRQILRSLYSQSSPIVDIVFSPQDDWLVAASRRGSEQDGYYSSLELWRGPNWKDFGILYDVPRGITSASFNWNGRFLAGGFASPISSENSVEIWNTLSWQISDTIKTGTLQNAIFAPQGNLLAVTPDRYAIQIWDVIQKKRLYKLYTSFTGAVSALAFTPEGSMLATGHYDGVIRLWDMRNGLVMWRAETGEVVQSLAFSFDGKLLASGSSYEDSTVRVWSAGSGLLLRTLEGHRNGVDHVLFSPDGQFLVSSSYDGMIRLWGIRP